MERFGGRRSWSFCHLRCVHLSLKIQSASRGVEGRQEIVWRTQIPNIWVQEQVSCRWKSQELQKTRVRKKRTKKNWNVRAERPMPYIYHFFFFHWIKISKKLMPLPHLQENSQRKGRRGKSQEDILSEKTACCFSGRPQPSEDHSLPKPQVKSGAV